ncbi:ABC transporter transmembrane domain-containing protein [Synechococcus sp. UW179A]|uniref:ABC transporter transmembrane domain-containing protein n=1 Tax=Synechococcus sp. UW179A TaxID=2575510 RepID=UPI000E0E7026|nr:ABC transporter transmembrane domain-containing protein [Synechococcus sp. UW179A]
MSIGLEALRTRFREQGESQRFALGQPLCERQFIPGRVLLIESGNARLLGEQGGRLSTLIRLQAGSFVGVASLLRAAPCEEVRAASEMVAISLSDEQLLALVNSDPTIAAACRNHLWEAELAALLQQQLDRVAKQSLSLSELLVELLPTARLLDASNDGAIRTSLDKGERLFLASQPAEETEAVLGDELIDPGLIAAMPVDVHGLPMRVIALPGGAFAAIDAVIHEQTIEPEAISNSADNSQSRSEITQAPRHVPVSRFNQTNEDNRDFFVAGEGVVEETLACFQMLTKLMKLPFRRDAIERVLRDQLRRNQTPTLRLCGQIAAGLGLHVSGAKVPASMGLRLQTPTLVPWGQAFALAVRSDQRGLVLASPSQGFVELDSTQLENAFPEGIDLLLIDRTSATPEQKFGPSWFWPALKRYRGVLVQVLIASFVVQLFTLANPLLIQVIIDKVIAQRSLDTLEVLGIALVAVTLLEGVLGSLKTYLFTETTNRIDQRLGAEVIDHLLRLPLGYFDRRPVGELGSRVAELEKIRNFLTGQALTTVLDAAFSVIYIVVMLFYSWVLTLVALAVLPIQITLTLLGAPLFRRQYRKAAEANASTASHLIEVLTGIQTVKSQNVEMVSRWTWQERYGKYISRTFEQTITGTALSQTSQVLQKISQLLVLWVGATLVLSGELTLGQLIAFRIISGYVTQPLLRLSSIWQTIQELRVSFERLADVIDHKQESDDQDKAKVPLPPIEGAVHFDNLTFAFNPGSAPVLNDVSLQVKPGTFVGIVGQSGSGKSTLMKLLPRLYSPNQGRILIDGYDIDKVELYSLRRQIGIVPQDPLLFSGNVNENIALTQPDASSEQIVMAAKVACAHDFIMELPAGYSTSVGERGASLSGGQRQRIAIARTLLANPKLLVMDEATSALDYETERRVCDNMIQALHDCTVFFITHRLSTVRRADLIVVMHQGAVVEMGSHDELMSQRGRYYALYRQQEAS